MWKSIANFYYFKSYSSWLTLDDVHHIAVWVLSGQLGSALAQNCYSFFQFDIWIFSLKKERPFLNFSARELRSSVAGYRVRSAKVRTTHESSRYHMKFEILKKENRPQRTKMQTIKKKHGPQDILINSISLEKTRTKYDTKHCKRQRESWFWLKNVISFNFKILIKFNLHFFCL